MKEGERNQKHILASCQQQVDMLQPALRNVKLLEVFKTARFPLVQEGIHSGTV